MAERNLETNAENLKILKERLRKSAENRYTSGVSKTNQEMLQAEVDKASGSFKGFERIKKITLTAEDFTTQNGMLTPSLKVKRRVVWQKYGPQIEALYASAEQPKAGASA